ncbi:hypothetical protein H0A73_05065 [Alcaligenaceae bacterium]|nr:hypothetical protein [Alcaligenaceae bacterium]
MKKYAALAAAAALFAAPLATQAAETDVQGYGYPAVEYDFTPYAVPSGPVVLSCSGDKSGKRT